MIHIVEIPQHGRAHAWFAFDQQDLLRKIYASDARKAWEIFDVATVIELLDSLSQTADTPEVRQRYPALCSLGDQHGWDTPLYRADYLLGNGVMQTEPVTETDACVAALKQRTTNCQLYWTDTQAMAAIEIEPVVPGAVGYRARDVLREQLITLEILEGI